MSFIDLKNTDIYAVVNCGKYVVLTGSKLYIFTPDGKPVASLKDFPYVLTVGLLPYDRIIVDCGKRKSYSIISLKDGSELLRIPWPKIDGSLGFFCLSPDKQFLYDIFNKKMQQYILKADLSSGNVETFFVAQGLRAIRQILCDEEGLPCLLETQLEIIGGRHMSINGVRLLFRDEWKPCSSYYWKSKWAFEHPRISQSFFGTVDYVLTRDFHVYSLSTGESFSLFENETAFVPPENYGRLVHVTDDRRYAILQFTSCNVVVDIAARKLAACYLTDGERQGCIVEDKFWLPTGTGLEIKEFPPIEKPPRLQT